MKIFNIPILFLLALTMSACGPTERAASEKIKFYQSPMHPWIKSDVPGSCTICGMALVPVLEGEAGFETNGETLILPESTIQVVGVKTSVVNPGTVTRVLRLAGVIEDDAGRHRIVSAHYDGRIEKPFIEQVGEEVRKEQPLAKIYSPDLLYVAREYQRAVKAKDQLAAESAGRRLIQYGLTPDQLRDVINQSPDEFGIDIVSPITGTVIKRYVNAGQYVKTGDPLFELGDFSRMWVQAQIYEQDIPLIHLGQKADITTPAAPGQMFEGVITLVDPNFDPKTRSTTLRIEVPNPIIRTNRGERRALPHGAYAEATIEATIGTGLVVPRSAVLDTGIRKIAYVDKGEGRYERRELQIQGRGDSDIVVQSGLNEGERVVISGNLLMDAESQMKDSGGMDIEDSQSSTAAKNDAPTPPPTHPLDSILSIISELGTALANDDLPAYRTTASQLHTPWPDLPGDDSEAIREAAKNMESLRHTLGGENLPDARAKFLPLSEAAAYLVLAMHTSHSGAANMFVFACPMTADAFPDAPAKARWIQKSKLIRNPWFGADMLECGAEIKP